MIRVFWISFILLIRSSSFCLSSPIFLDVLIKTESKTKLYHILTLANHSPKLYFSMHMSCFSSFYKGHIIKCFATAYKRSSLSNPYWFPRGLPSDHQRAKKCENVSCSVVSYSLQPRGMWPARLLCPWNPSGKNTGVGCRFLLQGIFLTQELNSGLLYCRWILYHLSHQI